MPDNTPSLPVSERSTVPVSALFSEAELAPPAPPVSTEPNTALTPAAPAVASPTKPAEVAAPTPAEVAAPTPAEVAKIKVGNKEYTKEELEAALVARATPAPPAAPVATPAPPTASAAPAPTPEQIAETETAWQAKFVADEHISVPFTEKDMETILAGEKEGSVLLSSKLNQVVAKAVLLARKSVYAELNPILGELKANLQPVFQNAAQVEGAAAEHQFYTAYPDFKAHADTVRRVGEALLTRYPNECRQMTREALLAEVAAQSDRIIQAECDRFAPGKNWRQLQAPATPAPTPAPAPVAPAPTPAPAAPAVKAPAANSPAAIPTSGLEKNWHKGTAASLAN